MNVTDEAAKGGNRAEAIEAKAVTPKKKAEGQPTPTKRRGVRQGGLQIDGFGLPVNGVARARLLEELGEADPLQEPADWNETKACKARRLTEKHYG